jgi:hypothetical protein
VDQRALGGTWQLYSNIMSNLCGATEYCNAVEHGRPVLGACSNRRNLLVMHHVHDMFQTAPDAVQFSARLFDSAVSAQVLDLAASIAARLSSWPISFACSASVFI